MLDLIVWNLFTTEHYKYNFQGIIENIGETTKDFDQGQKKLAFQVR